MSVSVSTLSNGLRVVSEQRTSLQTVAVGVSVGVGARNESAALNGITHCLEHMLFKGTEKRSALDIATEIERVGGHLNAYTSRDNTSYYARVLKEDLSLALDLLSDILLNSVFDDKEFSREKEVIIQEIGQSLDTPDDIVFDHLQAAAFKGQSLGRNILGTVDTVKSFTREDLFTYMQENYLSGQMVVSAVGNIDHAQLVDIVEERFGRLSGKRRSLVETARYVGDSYVEERDLEQSHLTLGWPGVSFHSDDYYAMQVYSMILGGGMSSRLFQEVREKRGLAYSVYSFSSSHDDAGLMGIYAGTSPEMANELLDVIRSEIEKLAQGFASDELMTATAQLKAGLMMGLETTTSRMEQLGRQLLTFGEVIPTEKILAYVDAITAEDVSKIARLIADETCVSSAIIGGQTKVEYALNFG